MKKIPHPDPALIECCEDNIITDIELTNGIKLTLLIVFYTIKKWMLADEYH